MKNKIKIEEHQLLDLIHWARRYCDGRATYSPFSFNQLYENIVQLNPQIKEKDQFDDILMEKGKYWPYAQDGQFNEKTGSYEARPRSYSKKEEHEDG